MVVLGPSAFKGLATSSLGRGAADYIKIAVSRFWLVLNSSQCISRQLWLHSFVLDPSLLKAVIGHRHRLLLLWALQTLKRLVQDPRVDSDQPSLLWWCAHASSSLPGVQLWGWFRSYAAAISALPQASGDRKARSLLPPQFSNPVTDHVVWTGKLWSVRRCQTSVLIQFLALNWNCWQHLMPQSLPIWMTGASLYCKRCFNLVAWGREGAWDPSQHARSLSSLMAIPTLMERVVWTSLYVFLSADLLTGGSMDQTFYKPLPMYDEILTVSIFKCYPHMGLFFLTLIFIAHTVCQKPVADETSPTRAHDKLGTKSKMPRHFFMASLLCRKMYAHKHVPEFSLVLFRMN